LHQTIEERTLRTQSRPWQYTFLLGNSEGADPKGFFGKPAPGSTRSSSVILRTPTPGAFSSHKECSHGTDCCLRRSRFLSPALSLPQAAAPAADARRQLTEDDVEYEVRQKGVDIKMGLDIASIAYKRLADRVVLITGDADFVPAAKLARREGLDVILDPLWAPISPSLNEHIDGLKTTWEKPSSISRMASIPAQPDMHGTIGSATDPTSG
jgi:uncharacterized LabA/DUF88 family protein